MRFYELLNEMESAQLQMMVHKVVKDYYQSLQQSGIHVDNPLMIALDKVQAGTEPGSQSSREPRLSRVERRLRRLRKSQSGDIPAILPRHTPLRNVSTPWAHPFGPESEHYSMGDKLILNFKNFHVD